MVKNLDAALEVATEIGSVTIPNKALDAIAHEADGSKVIVCIRQKSGGDVKAASALEVTIASGKQQIHSFNGKKLTIDLPVSSKLYDIGKTYTVTLTGADGTVETLVGKCVKSGSSRVVRVETFRLGTFVVSPDLINAAHMFTDIQQHWAKDAIEYVYQRKLMMGTTETTFAPNATLNRAMLATILYRMAGSPKVNKTSPFSDVKQDMWCADAVIWANENGIVLGMGNGKFEPTLNITRQQMAAMLYRYAKFCGMDVTKQADLLNFTDAGEIGAWAKEALSWANAEGLIQGKTASVISPRTTATRAEAATILMRFDLLKK